MTSIFKVLRKTWSSPDTGARAKAPRNMDGEQGGVGGGLCSRVNTEKAVIGVFFLIFIFSEPWCLQAQALGLIVGGN